MTRANLSERLARTVVPRSQAINVPCGQLQRRFEIRAARRRAALLPAALVIVSLSGCGSSPASHEPAPVSLPPFTHSSAASQDAAAAGRNALDSYRGMWQAYQEALQVPDPGSSELARYATGDALDTLIKGLQSVKDQGLKGTGTVSLAPEITSVSPAAAPTEIDVTDCMDSSDSRLVRVSPGPTYDDSPGGHRRVLATVRRQPDDSWKVSNFGAQAVGTC